MNDCTGFWFLLRAPGPLAAICFHHGPRKTMRWVQGLSSIVLSCVATQQAGWSRLGEDGPWTGHAACTQAQLAAATLLA